MVSVSVTTISVTHHGFTISRKTHGFILTITATGRLACVDYHLAILTGIAFTTNTLISLAWQVLTAVRMRQKNN